VAGPCNAANQRTFAVAPAIITVTAPFTSTVGDPISAAAKVTSPPGLAAPTGTVTFYLYSDATCQAAPAFTSPAAPLSRGRATSAPYTPTTPGAYHWIADYSGDANHVETLSACNAPNSTTVVGRPAVFISFSNDLNSRLGQPISAAATLLVASNQPAPTGTVTFRLFRYADRTCAGPALFDSGPRPLSGGRQPFAFSGPFTPAAAGTYRWTVRYSGDDNFEPSSTACGGPRQIAIVNPR